MKYLSQERGQAAITTLIVLFGIVFLITANSASIVTNETKREGTFTNSQQSYFNAESAVEDVLYRVKKGYSVNSTESVIVGSSTVPVSITSTGGVETVAATGSIQNAERGVSATVFKGEGVDFFYGIQAGTTGITMNSNSTVTGNVFSNGSITGGSNASITGSALAVGSISTPNPSVTGTKTTAVTAAPFPNFDDVYWKAQANINSNPLVGDLNYNSNAVGSVGPRKIQGNVNIGSNAQVTLTGPLYITGNLNINSNGDLLIDNSFGTEGTVVVVDGTINIDSNAEVHTTNTTPKGYILLVSLSSGTAANLNSNASAGALVLAPNGTVNVNSNAHAVAITAKGVTLNSNATITYDSGLSDANFSTGPSGGWQIQSWGESQ